MEEKDKNNFIGLGLSAVAGVVIYKTLVGWIRNDYKKRQEEAEELRKRNEERK